MLNPLTHGANATEGSIVTLRNDPTSIIREPLLNNTLPQPNTNTLPQPVFDTESVPVFYMFVQSDGQHPTSSIRTKEEDAEESQQSATDSYPEVPRPPLYTKWNPDSRYTRSETWIPGSDTRRDLRYP